MQEPDNLVSHGLNRGFGPRSNLIGSCSMVDTTRPPNSTQWLFSREELEKTPSSLTGHTLERERLERTKGCDFILKTGMKLRLPQTTISTACIFLHRFYMRFPLRDFHYYETAATTLFLATKCEETGRKLSDLIVACAKTAQKNDSALIDEQSKDYWRWRDVILYNEELLLEALCFDLVIEHPYTLLKEYLRQFGGGADVAKSAWACTNDSYRTMMHLLFDRTSIAVACLYYASIFSRQVLEDVDGKPWYLTLNVDTDKLMAIVKMLIDLYETSLQIAKDGYDPKLLARAGTEALRLLQEQLAAMHGDDDPAPETTLEEEEKTKQLALPESLMNGKRVSEEHKEMNGRETKKARIEDE